MCQKCKKRFYVSKWQQRFACEVATIKTSTCLLCNKIGWVKKVIRGVSTWMTTHHQQWELPCGVGWVGWFSKIMKWMEQCQMDKGECQRKGAFRILGANKVRRKISCRNKREAQQGNWVWYLMMYVQRCTVQYSTPLGKEVHVLGN